MPSSLRDWSDRAGAFAAIVGILGALGLILACATVIARRSSHAAPPAASAVAPEETESADIPPESEFPVECERERLLGVRVPGEGISFVVLDTLRADRVGSVAPPPAGCDVVGIRLGVASDSDRPVDVKPFRFTLQDSQGRATEPATVATSGQVLPGPRLSVLDVYYGLERDARPTSLTIRGPKGGRVTLPAHVVRSARTPSREASDE